MSKNMRGGESQRWLTYQSASLYCGVSVRTIQNWEKAGHLKTANVSPLGTRGRRLIDKRELDGFILSFVGAPKSVVVMNERRASV